MSSTAAIERCKGKTPPSFESLSTFSPVALLSVAFWSGNKEAECISARTRKLAAWNLQYSVRIFRCMVANIVQFFKLSS